MNIFLESPMGFGEPLKGDLCGLSSCPVKKSFIIVYAYDSISPDIPFIFFRSESAVYIRQLDKHTCNC